MTQAETNTSSRGCHYRRNMIKEPIYISPRTLRDYENYKKEIAYANGWNDAMRFIFGPNEKRDFHLLKGEKDETD